VIGVPLYLISAHRPPAPDPQPEPER
jgi:hypothetical protein